MPSAADILRSVVDLPGAAAGNPLAVTQKCRPADIGDHRRRLSSFRTHWWFNKPLGASPIECARRGWVNVGLDTVTCECCHADLRVQRDGETWLVNGRPVPSEGSGAATWAAALASGHGPFCPWRSHDAAIADPTKHSDRELVEGVEERLKGLRESLQHRPALDSGSSGGEGSEASSALEVLARAGWEFGGRGDKGSELLRCGFCLRTVAVQSFPHCPLAAGGKAVASEAVALGELGEPPSKAPRLQAAPAPEDGSSAELLPPTPGLWAPPAHTGAGGATAAGPALMDPYALHRFYCPVYSRADDDLGPVAARIVRVHAAASKAAAAAEGQGDGTSGPGGAEAGGQGVNGCGRVTSSAAARAEELLRKLDALLQPA
mmetsp:Transcript_116188/g.353388  ORF Transcript_116188/g.353388 Transcript_116188/m.353388 type:complete len:376 (+) Transcript_116188:77-1204(+)